MSLKYAIPDFSNTEKLITDCKTLLESLQSPESPLEDEVIASMANLVNILESKDTSLNSEDYTEIGELGMSLLRSLFYKAQQSDQQQLFNEVAIGFAYWLARHNATIKQIDFTVNAIAVMANTYHDKVALESLYEATAFIIQSVDADLKVPVTSLNSSDPWRLLNLNYGIIATRTHTPELMDSAFKVLLENFPDDAKGFFTQGMSEMERLDYPSHVRTVMQCYYDEYVD